VVNPNVTTGPHAIINSNATIEHEASLGAFVHVAPGATVLGRVTIQERTHIGAGAVIRQGASIGKDVMVGAGAVVASDLPDEVRAVGVPARFTGG
jgi:acetyltransferase-like isoleucine patch superfamily enzyme